MTFKPRHFVRFGLTAALLGSTTLAACGGENGVEGEAGEAAITTDARQQADETRGESGEGEAGYAGEMGEGGEGEGGEAGAHNPATMPRENRLAFMRGHVEAGLALYRADASDQAAKHLLHPVSETHAAEREGLDELGFKGDLFVEISEALEAGTSSQEMTEQLEEAEENLAMLADKAGGDPVEIVNFLMDTTLEEYRIGVVDGEIANAGEYQDAFGFVVVAQDYAENLEGEDGEAVRDALSQLQALWPEAPLAESTPTPVNEVASQVARVQLELSALR